MHEPNISQAYLDASGVMLCTVHRFVSDHRRYDPKRYDARCEAQLYRELDRLVARGAVRIIKSPSGNHIGYCRAPRTN